MTLCTVAYQAPLPKDSPVKNIEWVAIPVSKGSSPCRDRTQFSCLLHWQVVSLPLVPLSFQQNFKVVCSSSMRKVMSILTGIISSLQGALSSMEILTKLILPVQELGIAFHFFNIIFSFLHHYFYSFQHHYFYSFQHTSLSPPWLTVFPR